MFALKYFTLHNFLQASVGNEHLLIFKHLFNYCLFYVSSKSHCALPFCSYIWRKIYGEVSVFATYLFALCRFWLWFIATTILTHCVICIYDVIEALWSLWKILAAVYVSCCIVWGMLLIHTDVYMKIWLYMKLWWFRLHSEYMRRYDR